MEKYGTYVIFKKIDDNNQTQVEIPLDEVEVIEEFEKNSEWIRLSQEVDTDGTEEKSKEV